MTPDVFFEHLWQLGTPFAMLGIAVWYFNKQNVALSALLVKKEDEKNQLIETHQKKIDDLNRELRTFMENNINKAYEAINNNTVAFNALKEVLVRNNHG